jgi:hypothetical protein
MIGQTNPPGPDGLGSEPDVASAAPGTDPTATTLAAGPILIEGAQVRPVLEAIGSVVAQTTLLSALLYYFGYMYTDAEAVALGIDANTLGYSTRDYVLRSIPPVIPPIGFLLLVGLVLMRVHGRLRSWATSRRHLLLLDRLALVVMVVGMALLVASVLAIAGGFDRFGAGEWIDRHSFLPPCGVLAGIVGVAYGAQIRRHWSSSGLARGALPREPRWVRSVKLALIFLLIAVNLFWAVGDWAGMTGEQDAKALLEGLPHDPQAVLYSKEPLGIPAGDGITVQQVEGAEDGYRFRYGGLRYLTRSAGKYFLLSPCWSDDKGRTIVLTDDDSVRVEVTQSRGVPQGCR